jgi:hypothetical protein
MACYKDSFIIFLPAITANIEASAPVVYSFNMGL